MIALPQASRHAVALAAICASFALTAPPAFAQPQPDRDQAASADVSGITVYGPERYGRDPVTGARVKLDSVFRIVALDDLDLTTPDGAREAKRRIDHAARDVCDKVQDLYPYDNQTEHGCQAVAVRAALRQVQDQLGYPIVAWGYGR